MSAAHPAVTASNLPGAAQQAGAAISSTAGVSGEQIGPSQEAQERQAEMPLPQNLQSLLLMGIFVLLMFFALYFTGEVVLPIIFAIILYLVLQPAMRGAAKLRVPKAIAALLIIVVFFGGMGALGFTLSGPAADWVSKAPDSLRRIEDRLFVFKQPIADLQSVSKQVEKIAEGPATDSKPVTVAGPGVSSFLFSGTRTMLVGLGTTVILLFFLLVSGDLFLRRFVEILPTLSNKKQAVEISREIESNISSYLATISLMNLGVGILTGIAVYLCGLSDPILWGTVAFLLNFVPILGPLCGMVILVLAGLLTFDVIWQAVLPAGIYLVIHIVEGETVTPMLLARRFILNPALVIISLIFWYWMWGIAGALLAVPLLATVKIICDRIRPLMALGHFLGAEARA
jgi:predicted PurR-regulated permease PerM